MRSPYSDGASVKMRKTITQKFRRGVGSWQGGKKRRWSRHGGRQKLREECVATRGIQWIEGKSRFFLQVNWSIFNKTLEFWNLVDTYNSDAVIGTESWLREEISSAEVFRTDYTTFRRGRLTRLGGVFIYVKKLHSMRELCVDEDFEMVAVEETQSLLRKL